jgi:hypothetical protein
MLELVCLVAIAAAGACAKARAQAPSVSACASQPQALATGAPSRAVDVEGEALNVKGGPMIRLDDGSTLWVTGIGEWPSSVTGHRVAAHGDVSEATGSTGSGEQGPREQTIVGPYRTMAVESFKVE